VIVWDLSASSARSRLPHADSVTKLAFVPGSPILASVTVDGVLTWWDTRNGSRLGEGTGHAGLILDMAVVPAGPSGSGATPPRVVTAGDDGTCRVYALLPATGGA
jgi:WD40 repeat protein